MDMLYFFHSADIRSGAVKQASISQCNVQKLGSLELWSKLDHKVLPRPSQPAGPRIEEIHWKSQLHLEFQFFLNLQILNEQPSLRKGDLQSFVKNCALFFYRIAEGASAALQVVL